MTHVLAGLLTLAASVGPAGAVTARDAYVLLSGPDTIAVELFTSTPERLEGELLLRGAGLRVSYTVEYAADGLPARVRTAMARTADPAGAVLQSAELEFRGDSVVATVTPGAVQRFLARRGVQPYLNPSMAMLARAVKLSLAARGDTAGVELFALAGGSTLNARVARIGPDSVSVRLAGVEMRFALGRAGDLRGGRIPAQGITVVRGDDATPGAFAPPDYSAPAGAPYTAEEVRVPCPGGYSLAGTLTRPKGATGAVPCVVMLTGSGLQERDEAIPVVHGYRPFRQLADALARAGIATLRLDDRGFGASGGDGANATTADFADDARAALAWLRTRSGVDGAHLALLGHSEGGIVAPMVAADDPKLRGIVLLAGPAWTGRRVIEYQNGLAIGREAGQSWARRDSLVRVAMTKVDSLAGGSPWLHFFLDYDPLPTARRVRCPVLVMQGQTDHQVDPAQAPQLAGAIRAGGNRDVTLKLLADTNHLFLPDANGDPSGYAALKEAEIPPAIVTAIVDWLRARLR